MMQLEPDGGFAFSAFNRRTALAAVGAGLMSWTVSAPSVSADAAESVLPTFRSWLDDLRRMGQHVDPATIIHLGVMATHAQRTLASNAPPEKRPAILRLAARFAEYTGWMAQEKGDDAAASWWTDRAVEMATNGGDPELAAYALIRRADLTLYRDDWSSTLALAQEAQARSRVTRVRAIAAQREAQAHALAGDEVASRQCLDRSARLMAWAAQDTSEDTDEPVLGSATMGDLVAFSTGWCLFDLGRPREAVDVLAPELRRVPESAARTRARYGARLALAYAHAGEVEQACAVAAPVVAAMPTLDSATVRYDLRRLSRTLRRWRSQPTVRDLIPALAVALRTSTTPTSAG